MYARTTMMPPWVLASGLKPCGAIKNRLEIRQQLLKQEVWCKDKGSS